MAQWMKSLFWIGLTIGLSFLLYLVVEGMVA